MEEMGGMGNSAMNRVEKDIQSVIEDRTLLEGLKDKTVFITGATGLIGSMLIKTLHAANEKYGLAIKLKGQIRNREKAEKLLAGVDAELVGGYDTICDFIVHTVSPTTSKFFIQHPVETIQSSVLSTMEILETAKKYSASTVYLSSMEEYGVPYTSGEIMTEDKVGVIDHLNVRSSYSESKRLCECLCASYASEYGVDVKIARLAQTVGTGVPATDNRMPIQFAKAVVEGQDIVLHTEGKSVSNFVYLTDALKAILVLLNNGAAGEAYNVCNDGESRSVREIAELVCHEVAGDKINVRVEKKDNMGYAPDVALYLDSGKLRELGWQAEVGIAEAYRRLVEYIHYCNS